MELYFSSVGRNGKLLLNVPPTKSGLLHDTDVARLAGFRERLASFNATKVAARGRASWRRTSGHSAESVVDLVGPSTVSVARLEENIELGQSVARFTLYGADAGEWRVLARGSTIGYARLLRFEPARVRRVRLVIEDAVGALSPVGISVYGGLRS